ncbi:polysaccharide deacetylase family protein [Streptomyces sp. SB3404]|uniref:Polysaccharide deacetylase family protein n=1 Tax=Streptomyces boncukensis TaxID=2711219 RepID=A0A6G4X629_9ACTN|nr:polysaccharide deacetylase family protein [Streptomyces boncukensis]NGO72975.1 polysaccharide deacetylase family protein [Streptomyces boncukensis]
MIAAVTTFAIGLLTALVGHGTGAAASAGHPGWERSLRGGGESAHADSKRPRAAAPHRKRAAPPPRTSRDLVHTTAAGGRSVALTLDDGPHPVWTPKVLDLLKRQHVKATFCLIGPNAQRYPALVKRIVAEGHRLCDHTVSHDETMDHKSVGYQQRQILEAQRMIDKASGGARVHYYRAPGGAFTPDSRRIAAAHGMRPLGWTADPGDWQRPGTAAIVARAKQQLKPGAVLLLHDGGGDRAESYAALEQLIPWLKGRNYTFAFPES